MDRLWRGSACLWLLSVLGAAPAAAQLLDAPGSDTTQSVADAPARVDEEPAAQPPRTPPKEQVQQTPTEIPSAPPSIAKAPPHPGAGLPDAPEKKSRPLLILFLGLLGLGVALFVAERARSWITTNVPVRRVLTVLVMLLRLGGLAIVLAIVLKLIPGAQDWILWALLALAVVVGWSIRDLFADLVAGLVLAAERRVKKGVWVSGEGFQGTVEGRSLRATWLRDGQGHRLTVPNRAMVGAPMVYDSGADAEHEVVVRLEGYEDAGKVRLALTDAILSSPWVLAGATPVVLRDPADPVVWRVRTKLLEPRFSVHFEGELLERVEDLLRYQPRSDDRETVPSEAPGEG
ncbi:MAG: mechanosensitive ion channel domain-containing protein [Polyangiales bacterium]